jgi:hypothetical protein
MGCNFKAYWIGTFIADYIIMAVPMIIMFITWFAADMKDFYTYHDIYNTDDFIYTPFHNVTKYNKTTDTYYNVSEPLKPEKFSFTHSNRSTNPGLCFFLMLLFTFQMIAFSYFFSFVFTTPKSTVTFMPTLILLLLIFPNIVILIGSQIYKANGAQISTGVQGFIIY